MSVTPTSESEPDVEERIVINIPKKSELALRLRQWGLIKDEQQSVMAADLITNRLETEKKALSFLLGGRLLPGTPKATTDRSERITRARTAAEALLDALVAETDGLAVSLDALPVVDAMRALLSDLDSEQADAVLAAHDRTQFALVLARRLAAQLSDLPPTQGRRGPPDLSDQRLMALTMLALILKSAGIPEELIDKGLGHLTPILAPDSKWTTRKIRNLFKAATKAAKTVPT
jgi:hypothetical protein